MKNTSNMGMGKFEKSWKDAFEGASLTPSDKLWVGIEATIANDEVSHYRRGLAYYRWLAAAGVLLLAGLLGYISYTSSTDTTGSIAKDSETFDHNTYDRNTTMLDSTSITSKEEAVGVNEEPISEEAGNLNLKSHQALDTTSKTINRAIENTRLADNPVPFFENNQSTPTADSKQEDIKYLVALPQAPEKVSGVPVYPTDKQVENNTLWAGINMTPGYFNPNYQSQGVVDALQSPDFLQGGAQPMEEHRTGSSMSFGLEMGMRLSKRWQLSGGLQYLNNNVQSTTNTILDQRTPVFSSVAESLDLSDSRGTVSFNQTELDNTFQFLSIPIQAGFTVLDSKLRLQVNAGIASDFFLKNRITAVDHSLDPVTIDPGSNAPFRSVYFNGLVGAQASYEFLPRYMITLEPRYKLAISDFARPGASYTSLPSSFGVGVGVKYVFK